MFTELRHTVTDPAHHWNHRLLRLQGWRGDDVCQAAASGGTARLAPAFCAVAALAAAALASPALAAIVAVTALYGVVASNHPVELAANALAARRGVARLPANRAAKRLGCVLGVLFLGGAAAALAAGLDPLGRGLAAVFGITAAFVAISNICVPSVIFTVLWGAERAQAPSLAAALRHPTSARPHEVAAGLSAPELFH